MQTKKQIKKKKTVTWIPCEYEAKGNLVYTWLLAADGSGKMKRVKGVI
jgi:hypothetical protein